MHALLGIADFDALMAHPTAARAGGLVVEQVLRIAQPDEAYFWATHGGAELDLLLLRGGQRIGVEIKRMDSPRVTPSMQNAARPGNSTRCTSSIRASAATGCPSASRSFRWQGCCRWRDPSGLAARTGAAAASSPWTLDGEAAAAACDRGRVETRWRWTRGSPTSSRRTGLRNELGHALRVPPPYARIATISDRRR